MFAPSRFPIRARALMLLGVCVLALAALPPRAAEAAFKQNTIDNSVADFGRGQFQRAALGSLQNAAASPKLPDLPGAIQLGPIGILSDWLESPFNLKKPLIRMGATAIGNRIYVIGGRTPVGSVQAVGCGCLVGAGFDSKRRVHRGLAGRAVAAGAARIELTRLYHHSGTRKLAGGRVGCHRRRSRLYLCDRRQYFLRRGRVFQLCRSYRHCRRRWACHMVGRPSAARPESRTTRTVQQLGARIGHGHQLHDWRQYLCVCDRWAAPLSAGLRRPDQVVREGLKTVYYARVGSGGQLVRPSNGQPGWDRQAQDIPSPDGTDAGLWDATVMADHFVAGTGASQDALYVVGGQVTPDAFAPTFSSAAYRAVIGNTGALRLGLGGHAARDAYWPERRPVPRPALRGRRDSEQFK